MAGTSPRRSVRSRTNQPPNSGSHESSASSNSSGRAERATRTSVKAESPRKTSPTDSLSSGPLEDVIAPVEDNPQTRRRKRGQVEEEDKSNYETANEVAEDDEAVRCICGFDEYPGPPQISDEDKKTIKDSKELDIFTDADYTEDLAGFFLQCDMCKVWQHGGCVGIKNADMSPDEYFCEECRKDLHKILIASNGQKYSRYLPIFETLSRSTSRAASFSQDGTKSPRGSKSGRLSSSLQAGKRRSTMNSRDAAYDEEEQLRRAIEASKGGVLAESTDGGTRRGKRGRSESEEKLESQKRQRTLSGSISPSRTRFTSHNDSDDGGNTRNGAKKIRGAAARNHREKELREERERSRAEAATKRKGRAERRRVDDSDPSDEIPLSVRASGDKFSNTNGSTLDLPASSQPTPDTPPAVTSQPSTSHKKGGRPPQGRKGKLGKNQYTRDKDKDATEVDEQSPNRSDSNAARADDAHRASNSDLKSSKTKAMTGSKVTFTDMKRRVSAMLDFISRTQLDMAGESMTPNGTGNGGSDATAQLIRSVGASLLPMITASAANGEGHDEDTVILSAERDFKDLTLLEMMDHLTRELVKWQKQWE